MCGTNTGENKDVKRLDSLKKRVWSFLLEKMQKCEKVRLRNGSRDFGFHEKV